MLPLLVNTRRDRVQQAVRGLQGMLAGQRLRFACHKSRLHNHVQVCIGVFVVRLPAGSFRIIIPAVNWVIAVVEDPIGANRTKRDGRAITIVNVIARHTGMVIVKSCSRI